MRYFDNPTSKHSDQDQTPVMTARWFANAVDQLDTELGSLLGAGVCNDTDLSIAQTQPPYEVRLMLEVVRDKLNTWAYDQLEAIREETECG